MRLALVLLTPLLVAASCVTVEQMTVHTVAVDCNVTRGSMTQANGAGGADLVKRAGQAQASLLDALSSEIDCRAGTVEAISTVDRKKSEPAQ